MHFQVPKGEVSSARVPPFSSDPEFLDCILLGFGPLNAVNEKIPRLLGGAIHSEVSCWAPTVAVLISPWLLLGNMVLFLLAVWENLQ